MVLTSYGAYARGSLLRGGTRMDHQRDSGWIEPLEATALSDDEEAETQTPVSVEGDMNWAKILFSIRYPPAGTRAHHQGG